MNDLFKRIANTGKTPNRDTVVSDPTSATTPESAISSSAKKRTPPTPPDNDQLRNKKYHLDSEENSENSEEENKSSGKGEKEEKERLSKMNPTQSENLDNTSKESHSSINFEEKLDGFPEEYKVFGRALCEILTKNNENTLNELIKPLKADIKTLLDEEKEEKTCQQIVEKVQEDHVNLVKCCEKIETENKELRSRLNRLENKMLGNNIIMHGVREDTWELDDNRKEKVYKAIAPTVDEKDRRKQH